MVVVIGVETGGNDPPSGMTARDNARKRASVRDLASENIPAFLPYDQEALRITGHSRLAASRADNNLGGYCADAVHQPADHTSHTLTGEEYIVGCDEESSGST